MNSSCGCCKGVGSGALDPIWNRPGLDALRYRVGTHATFLDGMIAALTLDADPALEALTTRAPDDATIALLDAWAIVADVLTFYQERIANEAYLRTATERRSIIELGRLVGYELRPGVAASVYLAYTLDKGYDVEIPSGARAQSLPGPGELPQPFETSAPLEAREAWNNLQPRLTRPSAIVRSKTGQDPGRAHDARTVEVLYLDGTSTNLKPNDRILLVFHTGVPVPRTVLSSEPDAAARRTKVVLAPPNLDKFLKDKKDLNALRPDPASLNDVVDTLKQGPAKRQLSPAHFSRQILDTFAPTADAGISLLAAANPLLKETFYRAWENAILSPAPPLTSVEALRVKAPLFGHNAPPKPILNSQGVSQGTEEWPLGDTLTVTIRIGASENADDSVVRNVRAFARATVATGIEVAFRKGPEAGVARLPFSRGTQSTRLDGVEISLTIPTEGEARTFEIVIAPESDNRFGLKEKQQILLTPIAPPTGEEGAASRLSVSIQNGAAKDPEQTLAQGQTVQYQVGSRNVTIDATEGLVLKQESRAALSDAELARSGPIVALDAPYDQIVPGSWILIERLKADGSKMTPFVTTVKDAVTLTKTAYGITAKVTQLTLEEPWLDARSADWLEEHGNSLAAFRAVTVYAQSDPQKLTEEPITDEVAMQVIELQSLYDGLDSGRWLIVAGERTDIPGTTGVPGAELVMLARIEQDVERYTDDKQTAALEGSRTRSVVYLTDPLAYKYKRDTVRIYGNVVKASHGETRIEVLGSGDGSKAFQGFTLKQPPLTYVAATNPSGIESTLDVRVNEVSWHQVPALFDAGPDDRSFITQTDDAGRVTVMFGDGFHGARLPTGLQNVTSVYRNGIGKPGNVAREQITLLTTRPLGVREVTNPLPASGGADPENRDDARGNVPLALLALDRLVSVADYEAFTRAFAGIGKASAVRLTDGHRTMVHITIAGADDIPVDDTSDLYRHLNLALRELGDPQQAICVESRVLKFLIMSATVALLPDYHWDDVERKLRGAILDAFSFKRRQLGQDAVLSEVLGVMHSVEGVQYVDVDTFDAVAENTPAEELKTLGNTLALQNRIVVNMASANPVTPAELAIFTPEVPDTLILRGPQK